VTRWTSPQLPRLPGRGLPVRVFDTATGGLLPTATGLVTRMYVCGITPYDATHLGHAATYVAFDLLNRAWRDAGHQVQYVQNVTDVDDPLLERAAATGVDWQVLAKEQTDLFAQDMAALSVLAPDAYVGAVEGIPLVVESVERLLAAGHAYRVAGTDGAPDGDVYFSVHDDPRFGSVANLDDRTMLELFAERGGDPDRPGKRHPLDCLLWRVERPNEPAWDGASRGRGRPGWHVECTSIALHHLGMSFDVQGGGADLKFPHHEMGASEGQVLTGSWPYARVYAHAGMVGLDGHKMSKSRGNLVFVSRLRAQGVEPARSGWRCWPTITARTGSGRRPDSSRRRTGWPGGAPPPPVPRLQTPTGCWRPSGSGWPTTWTLPERCNSSTPGPKTDWLPPSATTGRTASTTASTTAGPAAPTAGPTCRTA
jgi:L-cysteine:1D-myo-inositol 2-amino-2-deoxy-alpha-D-glucopyranoside ligase